MTRTALHSLSATATSPTRCWIFQPCSHRFADACGIPNTLDEFVAATKKTLQEAVQYADEINSLSDTAREKTLSKIKYINEQYVRIEDNRLIVDKNFANMDIVNFKICRHIYRTYVNLTNELQRNGYTITRHTFSEIIEKMENKANARVTFKELFDEYHRLKTTRPFFSLDNHEELCARIAEAGIRRIGNRQSAGIEISCRKYPSGVDETNATAERV